MKLKGKHTSKFLILIAGLVIFAHAVIPHHHHFDSVEGHTDNLECETNDTDEHNEDPDAHCHAFNYIISENGNDLNAHSVPAPNFNIDLFDINTDLNLASKLNEVNYIHWYIFPPDRQIFLTNILLRGPPATV